LIFFGNRLQSCQTAVRDALSNDFDTPEAMRELASLVGYTHSYIATIKSTSTTVNSEVLASVTRYIDNLLHVFGLESLSVPTISTNDSTHKEIQAFVDFR
jgi:cysteinyl-tRNA synthetase